MAAVLAHEGTQEEVAGAERAPLCLSCRLARGRWCWLLAAGCWLLALDIVGRGSLACVHLLHLLRLPATHLLQLPSTVYRPSASKTGLYGLCTVERAGCGCKTMRGSGSAWNEWMSCKISLWACRSFKEPSKALSKQSGCASVISVTIAPSP
jgi:hypothetical protein